MRVPINSSQNNQSPNSKIDQPSFNNRNNTNNNIIGFRNICYEPTSVLDLCGSPSPVTGKPTKVSSISDVVSSQPNEQLEWDEHVLHNLDWDSIMTDLGMNDDSVAAQKTSIGITTLPQQLLSPIFQPQIPNNFYEFPRPQLFDPTQLLNSADEFNNPFELYSDQQNHSNPNNPFDISIDHLNHHQYAYWNVGYKFIEDLIRAADCVDSDDLQHAQLILKRLNNQLRSPNPVGSKPIGKPLQRAALYFKEALNSALTGSNRPVQVPSWSEIVQTIRAYKVFSNISPIPMFSQFTINQALLEALNGSSFIHVIDFDIGLGCQYASFMKELAEKYNRYLKLNYSPVLRITAIVSEEYEIETNLIRENLSQFAQELKIRFQVEFILLRTFEMLSFKSINFKEEEKIALVLSPFVLRRFNINNNVSGFLKDVRRVLPAVVVFVDSESWDEGGGSYTASFRKNFLGSLEFYATVLESLDATMASGEWVPNIETFLVRPKIQAAVEASAERKGSEWRDMFVGAGMSAVQLSQFAYFQAECLLGKFQVRGFHVAKRDGELVLCWHERPLVATSAWRC